MNNIHRGAADELETFVMENCLMLFKTQAAAAAAAQATASGGPDAVARTYTCKTCGKKFHSFQALGGHRASHKKLKAVTIAGGADVATPLSVKQKSHACTICGVEFPIGQALGGHMRRHRTTVAALSGNPSSVTTDISVETSDGNNNVINNEKKRKNEDVLSEEVRPVLKKSGSSKRVSLDFNLSFAPWIMERKEMKKDSEIEEGEIVEYGEDEEDFLKLELRQPIRN